MSEKITPYKDSTLGKKQQIAKMFDTISNEYDDLNRVISFGIDINNAMAVYQRASLMDNINLIGIDCHIGSQLTEVAPFVDAMKRLLILVDQLEALKISLNHIDIGGGLGVRYRDESIQSVDDYMSELLPLLGLSLIHI